MFPAAAEISKGVTVVDLRISKQGINTSKISSDDLWRVRAKMDGKKKSPGKTYKTSKETNDSVYPLNQETGKYLETLAILYENFEQACTERKESRGTIRQGLQ